MYLHYAVKLSIESPSTELFLSPDDKEKLHDFEEECVEDYFRYKDYKFQSSSDERIRVINERCKFLSIASPLVFRVMKSKIFLTVEFSFELFGVCWLC